MAVGVNIGKANVAVNSRPLSGVTLGKANVAVNSKPPINWVTISKANVAVNSRALDANDGRRRAMFVS